MAGGGAGPVAVTEPARLHPSAWWVLAGLAAGAALGVASRSGSPLLGAMVRAAEPLGLLFVNAIRMTVVPLVAGMLISGIGGAGDAGMVARLAGRSLALGLTLAFVVAGFTMIVTLPLMARLPIDPVAAGALRAAAMEGAGAAVPGQAGGLGRWLTDLVPVNVVVAAARGGMLPLIVFALGLGFALSRLPPDRRRPVTAFFRALTDAMLVLVGWVIRAAPVGVFGLAAPLGARLGAGIAGALALYVGLATGMTVLALGAIVYPVVAVAGRLSPIRFARTIAPAQVVALSSRSTMATLPAMIDAAVALGVPEEAVAFVIPVAAATLRVGSAVGQTVAVLFATRLFGLVLTPGQLGTVLVTTVLTTFTTPGIPGGSIIVMVPILAAAGVPAGAVGVLLGADVLPDMIRTAANVTGGIAAAVLVGRPETATRRGPAGGPDPG